jgi:hypothetical protein
METSLHRTPFAVLGATTRDDRRRVIALADERSLDLDPEVCQKARADLTNPRTRLAAEIAWLPGVSPLRAQSLVDLLGRDPVALRSEAGLPPLARLNLLAAVCETTTPDHDPEDLAAFLAEISDDVELLDLEEIRRDINEDRAVCGFPEITGLEQIETEMASRRRWFRSVIKDSLNRLATRALIEVVTRTVHDATAVGEIQAPALIDDLVDSYEIEAQGFLETEQGNAERLIEAARDAAPAGEASVRPLVAQLCNVVRNWDLVAQPIQVSAKARGIRHEASLNLGFQVRDLALKLYNEHGMVDQSRALTGLLRDVFLEVPEITEYVDKDIDALDDIVRQRQEVESNQEQWRRDITYSVRIGILFKSDFSISPSGVSWKGVNLPLETITRLRSGGVRVSNNGIYSHTDYTIAWGDPQRECVLELRSQKLFDTICDKLWRAVGSRLLIELITRARAGGEFVFAGAVLRDTGIRLNQDGLVLFGPPHEWCAWRDIEVWGENGAFCIRNRRTDAARIALSYITVPNVQILEMAIRTALKRPGITLLSDILKP